MRKQMIENAAYEVATQVRAVEETVDAALAEAKGKVPGLRSVAIGDEGDCPPTTGRADLRVVA